MKPKNWIEKADDALLRAAERAREIAMRTRTPLHVMRNGRIVKLMPELETTSILREEPQHQDDG